MKVANDIYDRIGELMVCCETVMNAGFCTECPIRGTCLDESTFERVATKVKVAGIKELIRLADAITEKQEEESKTDEERRWEEEADYLNDRRCDPEDY